MQCSDSVALCCKARRAERCVPLERANLFLFFGVPVDFDVDLILPAYYMQPQYVVSTVAIGRAWNLDRAFLSDAQLTICITVCASFDTTIAACSC